MAGGIGVVTKFQTKMADKGWNLEYDRVLRKFVDPEIQKLYEIFFDGFMSGPVGDTGFHVVARITDKGLQFGHSPYIHKKRNLAVKAQQRHARMHGEGFILLSGNYRDLQKLESRLGYEIPNLPYNTKKITSKHVTVVQTLPKIKQPE